MPSGESRFELKIWCPDDPIPCSYAKALVASTKKVVDREISKLR